MGIPKQRGQREQNPKEEIAIGVAGTESRDKECQERRLGGWQHQIKVGLPWTLSCGPAVLSPGCISHSLSIFQTTRMSVWSRLMLGGTCLMGPGLGPIMSDWMHLVLRSFAVIQGSANHSPGAKSISL